MSVENQRAELIQVAAVAVAIVEDMDSGIGATLSRTEIILREVHEERYQQNEKWGAQNHNPFTWLMILMEEVGEVADEIDVASLDLSSILRVRDVVQLGTEAKRWLEA
jgi:hypothetical protein